MSFQLSDDSFIDAFIAAPKDGSKFVASVCLASRDHTDSIGCPFISFTVNTFQYHAQIRWQFSFAYIFETQDAG